MSEAKIEETQPTPAAEVEPEPKKRPRWWAWALIGVIGLTVIGASGAFGGYQAGLQQRLSLEATDTARQAEEQFALAERDMEAELYQRARQRLEYVIQLDPDFPGATELLAQALLALNVTATVTPVPTATLTPTPDLRGAEDLFFQVERLLDEGNWTEALATLDILRQKQPDYRAVDVDGMYYVALRNLGVEKISLEGQLEGGMYELARAENFGPLDVDAEAWRSWARLYVTGASYWDVNWSQVVSIFSELVLAAPNIRDTSGWTAIERLRQGLIRYGDQFALAEDYCNAQIQYEAALLIGPDANLEPTATQVTEACWTPTPRPKPPTETPQETATPGGEPPPAETPTPTPPPTDTPAP